MAAMPASWFLMLVVILGQGGNHLLDYASTEMYWKSRGVTPSVQGMTAILTPAAAPDIAPLLVELASPNAEVRAQASEKIRAMGQAVLPSLDEASKLNEPQVSASCKALAKELRQKTKAASVQRLMAIRTLGEMKKPEALPVLRPLLESPEMFVAEYARKAIALIEGKPLPEVDDVAQRRADVDFLPAGARAVLQQSLPRNGVPVEELIARIGPIPGMDKTAAAEKVTSVILEIAEQIGDVRVDSVTAGVAGDVGDRSGWVAVTLRGEYDSTAIIAWFRKQAPNVKSRMVGTVEVFSPEGEVAVALVDDHRCVFTAGPRDEVLPIEDMIKSIQTGKGGLLMEPEMKPLLGKIDLSQPVWGVMKVTDAYRQAPPLQPFDEMILRGKPHGAKLILTLDAKGNDAAGVKNTVAMVNDGVQMALKEIQNMGAKAIIIPGIAQAREFLASVKCEANGNDAQLTATVNRDALMPLLSLMLVRTGVAAEPPVEVQKAQPAQPVAPEH